VNEEGRVLLKKEKDFLKEERTNLEKVIEETIAKYILEILEQAGLQINDIEIIGIATPRNL